MAGHRVHQNGLIGCIHRVQLRQGRVQAVRAAQIQHAAGLAGGGQSQPAAHAGKGWVAIGLHGR